MRYLVLFFLVGTILVFSYFVFNNAKNNIRLNTEVAGPTINPFPYKPPKIQTKRSYLTYLVGDSMTEALGTNADGLRLKQISNYPNSEFVNYNYGFGSTNILSLNERLLYETTYLGTKFPPILEQGFDLIIIESFAYNPLSEFSIEDGLKNYEAALDGAVKQIIRAKPNSVLALMTPVAPNKENFAKYSRDLTQEVRLKWVEERESYIKKLIEYANKNHIPLIDVYAASQDENGNGNLKYIDSSDFIHPSKEGVGLIEQSIADFIFENKIFPQ